MARFRYLSPEEYDALDADQKFAYVNAALDHLIAQRARAQLRVGELQSPDLAVAEAARTQPPPHEPLQPQQQQQQQPQPPPAQDAQPSAAAKDQSGQTSRKDE